MLQRQRLRNCAVPCQVAQENKGAGPAEGTGAVTGVLEQLQEASSELGKARAALEAAVQQSTSPAPAPDSSLSAGMRQVPNAAEVGLCHAIRDPL